MKRFLNRSLVVALMLGASVGAAELSFAQAGAVDPKGEARHQKREAKQKMTPEQRIEKRVERMDARLDLSDAQVAQLRTVLREDQARIQQSREAMKAATTDAQRQAAREQMVANFKTAKERVDAILTEEQRTKMKAQLKEGRSKMRGMKREHRQERQQLRQELKNQK
jgi:periplasmic protein CpxP/Spy